MRTKIVLVCFTIAVIYFIFFSCNKKIEIIQLEDLDITYSPYVLNRLAEDKIRAKYFVVANPPRNKDSLLSLLSSHFQSFASDDTIVKYLGYGHYYYKETWLTHRDYKEKNGYSIEDQVDDLIVAIMVYAEDNRKKIILYNRRNRGIDTIFYLPWKKERASTSGYNYPLP